jgi:hypothetical protein
VASAHDTPLLPKVPEIGLTPIPLPLLLTAIQKLSLASNNLRGLPDEIAACTTLEELYLSNNAKFSYFPGSAGHLRWAFGFCSAPVWCVRVLLCGSRLPSVVSLMMRTLRGRLGTPSYLRGGAAAIGRTLLHGILLLSIAQEIEGAVAGQVPCPEAAAEHQ